MRKLHQVDGLLGEDNTAADGCRARFLHPSFHFSERMGSKSCCSSKEALDASSASPPNKMAPCATVLPHRRYPDHSGGWDRVGAVLKSAGNVVAFLRLIVGEGQNETHSENTHQQRRAARRNKG